MPRHSIIVINHVVDMFLSISSAVAADSVICDHLRWQDSNFNEEMICYGRDYSDGVRTREDYRLRGGG